MTVQTIEPVNIPTLGQVTILGEVNAENVWYNKEGETRVLKAYLMPQNKEVSHVVYEVYKKELLSAFESLIMAALVTEIDTIDSYAILSRLIEDKQESFSLSTANF